jgi:uncharacterized membrane protein (UPF0127 family)
MVVAGVIAAAALAGMIVIVVPRRSGSAANGAAQLTSLGIDATSAAAAPFSKFSQARAAFAGRCGRVLVASTSAQRVQGLRGVRTLGPYAGMLFAFPSDSAARFTMARTLIPLDVVWYAADGRPVDNARMTPCPNGTDATCPAYAARHRYRYALERVAGAGSPGPIGACGA